MSSTMNYGQFAFRKPEFISKISIQLNKHTKQVVRFNERSTAGNPQEEGAIPRSYLPIVLIIKHHSNLTNVF